MNIGKGNQPYNFQLTWDTRNRLKVQRTLLFPLYFVFQLLKVRIKENMLVKIWMFPDFNLARLKLQTKKRKDITDRRPQAAALGIWVRPKEVFPDNH